MNKIITGIVLAGLVTSVAIADPFNAGGHYSEERMQKKLDHRIEKISDTLELNQEQTDQLMTVMKEQMKKRKAFMQAHKQETEQRISAIVGQENVEKLKEMRAERKQHYKHKSHEGGMDCNKPRPPM